MANLVSDKISISRPLQFIIIAVFSGVLSTFFLSGLVGLYAEKNTIQIRQTKHIYEEFEDFMDERFVLANELKPHVQRFLLLSFAKGNSKVHVGKENHLFFEEDTKVLTSKKNCDNKNLIVENFRRLDNHFKGNKVKFYVGILPSKSRILHDKYNNVNLTRNSSHHECYDSLHSSLKKQGLDVFDVKEFFNSLSTDNPFLKYDSHWSFETMELFASFIAEQLRHEVRNIDQESLSLTKNQLVVRNHGDLYDMLDTGSTSVEKQKIFVDQISGNNGRNIANDRNSNIILIGDSFTNIYSDKSLRWGENAGLAYQLSYRLKKSINAITSNGSAFQTALLRNFLHSNILMSNSVVILIMAERELKEIRELIHTREVKQSKITLPSPRVKSKETILITKNSSFSSNSTPYQNVLIVHEAKLKGRAILIVTFAMKDNKKLTKINLHDKLKGSLIPFNQKIEDNPELSTYMMIDETDNYESEIYWIENIEFTNQSMLLN